MGLMTQLLASGEVWLMEKINLVFLYVMTSVLETKSPFCFLLLSFPLLSWEWKDVTHTSSVSGMAVRRQYFCLAYPTYLAFLIIVASEWLWKLLQARRSNPQGLRDQCSNCPHPFMKGLMFYVPEAHCCCYIVSEDSLPGIGAGLNCRPLVSRCGVFYIA